MARRTRRGRHAVDHGDAKPGRDLRAEVGHARAAEHDHVAEPEGASAAEEHRFAIRRSWEVAPITLGGGVTFRRLAPVPTPGVEFFESTYPPNAISNAHGRFLKHEGYEVGTVIQGELTIEFESDIVTLAVNDSITFPCARPHIIGNHSTTQTAVATWLIVHPSRRLCAPDPSSAERRQRRQVRGLHPAAAGLCPRLRPGDHWVDRAAARRVAGRP